MAEERSANVGLWIFVLLYIALLVYFVVGIIEI